MKRMILNRLVRLDDRILGRLIVYSDLDVVGTFATLELPWRNNERNKSCIPSMYYTVSPRTSQKFGHHLIINGTTPRELILFHIGNFPKDTDGCILVGTDFADIDGDGKLEVTSSKIAMNKLVELIREPAELIIL